MNLTGELAETKLSDQRLLRKPQTARRDSAKPAVFCHLQTRRMAGDFWRSSLGEDRWPEMILSSRHQTRTQRETEEGSENGGGLYVMTSQQRANLSDDDWRHLGVSVAFVSNGVVCAYFFTNGR